MVSLYVSIIFIFILSLSFWIFINSIYFFELYFNWKLKTNLSSGRENIFDTIVDSKIIPKYIKDAIGKSADKYELLSYYLMSEELIDRRVWKENLSGNSSLDRFEKIFIWARLSIGIIFLIYLLKVVFLDEFLNSSLKKIIIIYCTFIVVLVVSLPYSMFFKEKLLDKIQCVLAYWQVVVFSIFSSLVIYVFFQNDIEIYGKWVLDKNFIVYLLSTFLIFLGAYTYVGYLKFNYMNKFFELLKVNIRQNDNEQTG